MDYISVRPKADEQLQLNLPHGTKQKKSNEETENKKRDAQKKRSGREVRGVSPEAGRESMVEKISERGSSVIVFYFNIEPCMK